MSEHKLFLMVGILVSLVPFLTYALPMYRASSQLEEKHILYLFNLLVSGYFLFNSYRCVFEDRDKKLALSDSKYFNSLNNPEKNNAISRNANKHYSINFAFFCVNSVFLVAYLVVNVLFRDIFRELDEVWKFAFVSDVAAIVAFVPCKIGYYERLGDWLNFNSDNLKVDKYRFIQMLKNKEVSVTGQNEAEKILKLDETSLYLLNGKTGHQDRKFSLKSIARVEANNDRIRICFSNDSTPAVDIKFDSSKLNKIASARHFVILLDQVRQMDERNLEKALYCL